MMCSPQLIAHLRAVAAVRKKFPHGGGDEFAAHVRAERARVYAGSNPSTIALVRAIVFVCDECGIELDDVVANEALRDEVIDAALPTYLALRAGGDQ